MSREYFIPVTIQAEELHSSDATDEEHFQKFDNKIRVWRSWPDAASLQLRSYGSITGSRRGKGRRILSTCEHMTVEQLTELRESIDAVIKEIREKGQ